MGTVFDDDSNRAAQAPGTLPPPLAQLLTVTRANTAGVMERLLLQAQTGETPFEELTGIEYLLFTCGGVGCGVPLAALREVLPALPQVAPLPASPEWMMGIFALRAEMIALVDPAPIVLDHAAANSTPDPSLVASHPAPVPSTSPQDRSQASSMHTPRSALIVGTGERCLAWAISLVGDLVRLEDHEILPHTREATEDAQRVRERYILGDYIVPENGRRHTLLNAELVLDDVLHELEEDPDGRA
jgi:chemotaxis signal transduction protein